MKDYNELLHGRVDKSFNKILVVTSLVAFIASIFLFASEVPVAYAVINVSAGFILMLIYYRADRVKTSSKIIFIIIITGIIAVVSFIGGSFTSAFLSILMLSNILAVLFLNRQKSVMVSVVSMMIMFSFAIYSSVIEADDTIEDPVLTWGLQIVAFLMVLLVLHILVYAVKAYLFETIEDLEIAVDNSNQLAYYDQLTGLPNTYKYMKDVKKIISEHQEDGFVFLFKLRSLSLINSTVGQEFGDQTLIDLATSLKRIKSSDSVIARNSGNEFIVWIDQLTEAEMIERFNYVLNALQKESVIRKKKLEFYTAYSKYHHGMDTLEACYQRATLTLAYVKSNNISKLIAYNDELEIALRRKEAIKDLIGEAIESGEVMLYYQAQHDSRTNHIIGAEGLARWQSKELGWVSPCEFIPIIESLNLSIDFGAFVIHRAFSDYGKLQEKYNDDISLSINISPSHMRDPSIIEMMKDASELYEVPPHKVILEITEDIIIRDIEEVKPILRSLRALNFNISLDDFGSGYSSLNYLTQLEIDELKIDKSFVDSLEKDDRTHILIENMIHLSKRLNLKVIAEGVETKEQDDILSNLGCYIIQGYYYTKPERL